MNNLPGTDKELSDLLDFSAVSFSMPSYIRVDSKMLSRQFCDCWLYCFLFYEDLVVLSVKV